MQDILQSNATGNHGRMGFTTVRDDDGKTLLNGTMTATARWVDADGTSTAAAGTFVQPDATNAGGLRYYTPTAGELASKGAAWLYITGTVGGVTFRARQLQINVTSFDKYDAVRGGLTALPNVVPGSSGGLITYGSGAGQIFCPDGKADADIQEIGSVTARHYQPGDGFSYLASSLHYWRDTQPGLLQSGRVDSYLGAAGLQTDAVTEISDAVRAGVTTDHGAGSYVDSGTGDSAAAIADAVWDEARAGHVAAGSFGAALGAADLGSAGSLMRSSTGNQAYVNAEVGAGVGNVHAKVANTEPGAITAASIATGAIDADALAADAVAEIQSGLATSATVTAIKTKTDALQFDSNSNVLVDVMRISDLVAPTLEAGLLAVNTTSVSTGAVNAAALATDAVTEISDAVRAGVTTDHGAGSYVDTGAGGDATAANQATIIAHVDTLEAAVAAVQAKVDTIEVDTTALDARLTAARAGYLDNLNVGGLVASSAEVTAIQNNTRVVIVVPDTIERPDAGSTTYRVELFLYDEVGNMEVPDTAPTISLVNQAGVSRNTRLDNTTMSAVASGHYRANYTASAGDALEQLVWTFTVVEGGASRVIGRSSLIVDTTASDFTAADRAKLDRLDADYTTARAAKIDNLDAAVSTRPTAAQIDTQLSGTHGAGSWEGGGAAPTASEVADAVWDEPRAGHATGGTFGEGVNVVMIADGIITAAKFAASAITETVLSSGAANKIRDAVFSNSHYAGRTFLGAVRRLDQMIIGRHEGMRSALWRLFAPDGSVLVHANQDPATGNRDAASLVTGD